LVDNLTFFNEEELARLRNKMVVEKLLRCPICFSFGYTSYFAVAECGHAICCRCDSLVSNTRDSRCCLCKKQWSLVKEHYVKSFPADYEKRDNKVKAGMIPI
jgi:hypothetical protein